MVAEPMPTDIDKYVNRLRRRGRGAIITGVCFVVFSGLSVAFLLQAQDLMYLSIEDGIVDVGDLVISSSASFFGSIGYVFAGIAGVMLCMCLMTLFNSEDRLKDQLLVDLWDRVKAIEEDRNS